MDGAFLARAALFEAPCIVILVKGPVMLRSHRIQKASLAFLLAAFSLAGCGGRVSDSDHNLIPAAPASLIQLEQLAAASPASNVPTIDDIVPSNYGIPVPRALWSSLGATLSKASQDLRLVAIRSKRPTGPPTTGLHPMNVIIGGGGDCYALVTIETDTTYNWDQDFNYLGSTTTSYILSIDLIGTGCDDAPPDTSGATGGGTDCTSDPDNCVASTGQKYRSRDERACNSRGGAFITQGGSTTCSSDQYLSAFIGYDPDCDYTISTAPNLQGGIGIAVIPKPGSSTLEIHKDSAYGIRISDDCSYTIVGNS